jgi:hypothetical protein
MLYLLRGGGNRPGQRWLARKGGLGAQIFGPSGFLVSDISGAPNLIRTRYPLDTLGVGVGNPQVALGPG